MVEDVVDDDVDVGDVDLLVIIHIVSASLLTD